jgi:tripartite-type tricarboxylate transporter receptor subunit TctC
VKKQPEEHVHVRWVPSQGAAPALQEVAGGITTFSGSPGEAKSLADGGRVRVLALMADERSPAFPGCPDAQGVRRQLGLHQLVRARGAEGPAEVRAQPPP